MAAVLLLAMAWTEPAYGQQADLLRPGLDTDPQAGTTNQADNTTAQTRRTNAPQPPRLLSNQPPPPPPPPPLPPVRTPEPDPFAPTGLRTGSFTAFPQLEVSGIISDNARTTSSAKLTDIGLRLAPSLRLQSNWARHEFTLSADSEHILYRKASDNNSNTVNANAALRLDIRRNTTLTTTTTYALSQTSSASSDVPGTAIGNRSDHEFTVTSGLAHRFNKLVATLTAGLTWVFVDDVKLAGGGVEDNADREYLEPGATLRLAYDVSPAMTPFVQVAYTPRIHAKKRDRNNLKRNSSGITTTAGFRFNLSPIWDGEIGLTHEYRNFSDTTLKSVNAFGINSTINWRPSQITTISLATSTSIDESATIGISATRNYDASLSLTHRLRNNIAASLRLSVNYDDFVGTSNDDLQLGLNAGLSYTLNRRMEWTAAWDLTRFKSGTPGSSYTENRFTTGLRFRL